MTQTNTNDTPMTKSFSTNPKLSDWVPSEQQIQTITAARELLELIPEEEGDECNRSVINDLNVFSCLIPEVTDPKQLGMKRWSSSCRPSLTAPVPNAREETDAKKVL